ncbi:metalloendoproteinase 1 [Vigna angularis]|nr:metalloendoproteinase 1 [Vigna angularis]
MALNLLTFSISFFLFFVVKPFLIVEPRTMEFSEHSFTRTLRNLRGIKMGQRMRGMIELKSYLNKFGYLNNYSNDNHFDQNVEVALKEYQVFHHLHVTGHMDAETLRKMSLPRCGVPDVVTPHDNLKGLTVLANYTFFRGSPRWEESKRELTYRFVSSTNVLRMDLVRFAVNNAFQSWSRVSDFTFTEIPFQNSFSSYLYPNFNPDSINVAIGFHRRDHGDGHPFDGPGRVLAHTFAPQDGRLHLDADESWISGPRGESIRSSENMGWEWVWGLGWRRRVAPRARSSEIDLETVSLHEIGHLLGLGHSSVRDSIMYPSYEGVRRHLSQDDKDGIAALYGYQNIT